MLYPELQLYFDVEREVLMILNELTDPSTEIIMTDVDLHELSVQQGNELHKSQLYPVTDNGMGGVCFRGEIGKVQMDTCLKAFETSGTMSESAMCAYYERFNGQLVYSVPGITMGILKSVIMFKTEFITRELVFSMVIGIIAHERRHAVQTLAKLNIGGFEGKDIMSVHITEYAAQPSEIDALCFNIAVQQGLARMEDVETWQPDEEYKQNCLTAIKNLAAHSEKMFPNKTAVAG
jgi:hypothetical protein